jgi:thiol-disulfide isomerase/thioredoxin
MSLERYVISSFLLFSLACSHSRHENSMLIYDCQLWIDGFHTIDFQIMKDQDSLYYELGKDRFANTINPDSDSLELIHPAFNSILRFKLNGDSLAGYWYNLEKGAYKMELSGSLFAKGWTTTDVEADYAGRWMVEFTEESGDKYAAVGIFDQNGSAISGTFLTETGDYRFLYGTASEKGFDLHTFDFAHAFLFSCNRLEEGLSGQFYSGNHSIETWVAYQDSNAQLRNATELVKYSSGPIDVAITDIHSKQIIRLSDASFIHKPLLIQVFGSWCPNCYDESTYLRSIYSSYEQDGYALISIGFERPESEEQALRKLIRYKSALNLNYPVYYGGYYKKDSAHALFHFLDKVYAFPTLIFLNADHKIMAVHSGFMGPATGNTHLKTKSEIGSLIREHLTPR